MRSQLGRALLVSAAICLSTQAADIRLVTGDDYAPLTGQSLAGSGMLSQIVQEAFARSGMTSTLAWQPWNRAYLMTLRGEYDATFPYIRADRREQEFYYSEPVYLSEQHLFSRADDAFETIDAQQASGRRLCHPLGWQLPEFVQALVDGGLLVRHSPHGLSECAQLLLLGRDDFFLADLQLGRYALSSTGAPPLRFHISQSVLSRQTLHLMVPRSHPGAVELVEHFDVGLTALHASGEYERMMDNFLLDQSANSGQLSAVTH